MKFEKELINKLEIKNKIINIIINDSNDKMVNLIHGYNMSIAATLPHVPGANFIYPIKKIDTKSLVNIFIANLNY